MMFRHRHFRPSLPLSGMHPAVKAFVISELFFWSGWNFIIPIISIFVISEIPQATVQSAASAFTAHLIIRIITEILVSRRISQISDVQRALLDALGMSILSLAYFGIAYARSIHALFAFYIIAGASFGISSPAKLSLFSKNLPKDSESMVWGMYDALVLAGMAIATTVGGYVANQFGFKALFLIASLVNIMGIVPYILFYAQQKRSMT